MENFRLKTQVIGAGVVGSAQIYLLQHLRHEVNAVDPKVYPKNTLKQDVDLTFICTPETVVEDVIDELVDNSVAGLYVIKSTVPTGETERLMKKYDIHICHNPEFLRAKHSYEDVINQSRILIGGCCQEHINLLTKLYAPLNTPIYVGTPKETETAKIVTNTLRAVMITFWNEVHAMCKQNDVSTRNVSNLVQPIKTLSTFEGGNWGTKMFGKYFDGTCLPKDLKQLINLCKIANTKPQMLEGVKSSNALLKLKTWTLHR